MIPLAICYPHLDVQEPSQSQHVYNQTSSIHRTLTKPASSQRTPTQFMVIRFYWSQGEVSELLRYEIEDIQSIVQVPSVLLHDPENEWLPKIYVFNTSLPSP